MSVLEAFGIDSGCIRLEFCFCIVNSFGMHFDLIRYAFGASVKILFGFRVHAESIWSNHSELSVNAHRVYTESIPI